MSLNQKTLNRNLTSEDLYNIFFQKLDLHAWYLEDVDFYQEINKNHANFFGLKPEKVGSNKIIEIFPVKKEAEVFIEDNKVVFRTGRKLIVEQSLTDQYGKKHILKIKRQPVYDDDGNIKGVFCLGDDITEKRKAEKNFYEREELFQSIIATIPDILLFLDDQGRYLKIWTGQNENLFDVREKLLGKTINEVLPEKQGNLIMKNLNEALKDVEIKVFEYELEVLGGRKWFEARMIAAGSDRAVMVVRDISDRVSAYGKIEELHNVAIKLASANDEETVYKLTVEAAEKILEFDVCTLDLVEDEMFKVKMTSTGVPEGGSVSGPIEGIGGKVYNNQESHLTKDVREEELANPVKSEYRSAITVPIEEYGIFQVISVEVGNFDENDLKLTELLVSHTATAIKRLRAEKEIRYLGFHDKLTGLYNRMFVEEELKRLDSERQLPLSIIAGDVNSLKLVNDAFGHKAGDDLLKKVAAILKESCRKEDIIGRFGGDEFTIILPNTSKKEAEKILARIKDNCKNEEDTIIPVSIALGLATKADENEDVNEVLKNADTNMYENKIKESEEVKNIVLETLMEKLGEKEFETQLHCERLKKLAAKIGAELEFTSNDLERLKKAAYLHDIGMISASEEILKKEESLTESEWNEIKKHPETGYRIARSSDKLTDIANIILYHHERWDGNGYPRGIKGEEIPIQARIITVIDAYDVMVNNNLYKEALTKEEAIAELYDNAGSQFDPEIVDIFVKKII
ncbi:MAG: HD domain-containing phosphohydrolase [Halarsenatibacteraceae bacterium]